MSDITDNIKRAYRNAKAESGISLRRVFATALGAVTMALISSQLTSILNSLLIVMLVSMGTALAGETYRIILSVTAEGTKKVAETTKKVIVPIVQSDTKQTDIDDHTETPITEPPDVKTPDTETLDTEIPDEGAEVRGETPGDLVPKNARKNPIRTNQYVQLAVIFGVVAMITVGVTYAVASSQGHTDITYNYSHSERNPLTTLTKEQQQSLADLAITGVPKEHVDAPPIQTERTQSVDTHDPDLDSLRDELTKLSKQNEDLLKVVEELQKRLASESSTTEQLSQQIVELEKQVDALSSGGDTPEPDPPVDTST